MPPDGSWAARSANGIATCEFLPKAKETKMSEINETFTEPVDVTTQPDGAFIGTLEVDVRPADRREQVQALQDECDGLRDRVAELEAQLAALD
jgi:hypothetical protein